MFARGDPPAALQVWGPGLPQEQGRGRFIFRANSGISLGKESRESFPLQFCLDADTTPCFSSRRSCPGWPRGTVGRAACRTVTPHANLSLGKLQIVFCPLILKSLGAR